MASRLGFLVRDLAAQVGDLSPESAQIEVRLDPRTYRAVVADLRDHVGDGAYMIAEVGGVEVGVEFYGVVFSDVSRSR